MRKLVSLPAIVASWPSITIWLVTIGKPLEPVGPVLFAVVSRYVQTLSRLIVPPPLLLAVSIAATRPGPPDEHGTKIFPAAKPVAEPTLSAATAARTAAPRPVGTSRRARRRPPCG